MSRITYEVGAYENIAAFVKYRPSLIEEGIKTKRKAIKEGERLIGSGYERVKIQSNDLEFIEILEC